MTLPIANRVLEEVKQVISCVNDIAGIAGDFCIDTNGSGGDFDQISAQLKDLAKVDYDMLYELQGQIDQISGLTGEDKELRALPDQDRAVANDENFKKFNENVARLRGRWAQVKAGPSTAANDDPVMETEELAEGSAGTQSICPVSKKPIVNPVRLLKCQHLFDRDSILAHIANTPAHRRANGIRCPYWGCQIDFSPDEVVPVTEA